MKLVRKKLMTQFIPVAPSARERGLKLDKKTKRAPR
jgi:hypothetical protein